MTTRKMTQREGTNVRSVPEVNLCLVKRVEEKVGVVGRVLSLEQAVDCGGKTSGEGQEQRPKSKAREEKGAETDAQR